MSDIQPTVSGNNKWVNNSIFDSYDETYLEEQRKLFEEERASQKQAMYNQMAANEHKGSTKDRNSRLAAIVAKHRIVI